LTALSSRNIYGIRFLPDPIHVKRYSIKTDQAYVRWIGNYIPFKKRQAKEKEAAKSVANHGHLVVVRKVEGGGVCPESGLERRGPPLQ
jgi:hypothetical protein